jgi:glycerol transport system substrate-binding protein
MDPGRSLIADQVMSKLQGSGIMKRCEPRIAEPQDPEIWLARPGAPKLKLDDQEAQGRTVDYVTPRPGLARR